MNAEGAKDNCSDKLRVLVIDDHPVVLEGVKSMLSAYGWYVMGATTSREALLLLLHAGPVDVAVIDLALENPTDGMDLLADMRKAGFKGGAVMFTMHDELWNARSLAEADVNGIVLKGDRPDELIAAISKAAEGGKYFSEGFEKVVREAKGAGDMLTERDMEVLHLVARGLDNAQIADRIFTSVKTVEYHRSRVIHKLGASSMPEAVAKAISLGLIKP